MAHEVFFYLTTTGWKSGKPHEIEIWFVEHEGAYYLIAEHGQQAHWVQNIQYNSAVAFHLTDQPSQAGTAQIIDDNDALAERVKVAFDAKYNWSAGLVVGVYAN